MDTRALVGVSAALGVAAGLGLGYALFHSDNSKTTPSAGPAAVTSSASSSAANFTLDGKLTLKWSTGAFERDNSGLCAGMGGYSDIVGGAGVTITDQGGTVIATGTLDYGHADVDNDRPIDCVFSFSVAHVPDGKTFYGVTVSHRGAISYSAEQAKSGQASLSLG